MTPEEYNELFRKEGINSGRPSVFERLLSERPGSILMHVFPKPIMTRKRSSDAPTPTTPEEVTEEPAAHETPTPDKPHR